MAGSDLKRLTPSRAGLSLVELHRAELHRLEAKRHLARSRAGLSLVELMIVLVVIGVMIMTVAPSLTQVLADNRQSSAAADMVRIAARARAAAVSSGVAHMLRFRETEPAGSNLGLVELYAGMNNRCAQTPWDQVLPPAPMMTPVGVLDMTEYNPGNGTQTTTTNGGQVVTLRANDGIADRAELRICYQPNGAAFTALADGVLSPQANAVLFTLARTHNGVPYGRNRRVVLPVAGSPRQR